MRTIIIRCGILFRKATGKMRAGGKAPKLDGNLQTSIRRLVSRLLAVASAHLSLRLRVRVWRRWRGLIFLLVVLMIVVNRILAFRTLQLDGDFNRRLVHIVVPAEGLAPRGQHLHPQLAVGNAVKAGLAVRVSFEFEATAVLLVMLAHRMHHDSEIG